MIYNHYIQYSVISATDREAIGTPSFRISTGPKSVFYSFRKYFIELRSEPSYNFPLGSYIFGQTLYSIGPNIAWPSEIFSIARLANPALSSLCTKNARAVHRKSEFIIYIQYSIGVVRRRTELLYYIFKYLTSPPLIIFYSRCTNYIVWRDAHFLKA